MTQPIGTDLFAVILLHHTTFHRLVATVAAIVPTSFVVVLVVAIAVSLVLKQSTRRWRLTEVLRIDTFALQNDNRAWSHMHTQQHLHAHMKHSFKREQNE